MTEQFPEPARTPPRVGTVQAPPRKPVPRSGPTQLTVAGRIRQAILTLAIVLGMGWAGFWALVLVHGVPHRMMAYFHREDGSPAILSGASESRPRRAPLQGVQAPPPHPQIGINLSGVVDWSTELPFVDVFRLSRPWISQKSGLAWGAGPALELDPHGWVKRLEPECWAETPLCTIEGGHYPPGLYTLFYEGEGEFEVSGAAQVVSRERGKITLDVKPSRGGFFVQLRAVNPQNYVREIRVVMPGFVDVYRENPWNPSFLKRWEGMACVRFMDWMDTNGSSIRTWSERPQIEDATFAARGVPAEVLFDLAGRLKTDAWVCMPHRADDDYVRRFAQLAREKLAPGRKLYVEYSNELWNAGFEQCKYAIDEGRRLGLEGKPWEAGWKFTARRSTQIFKIWKEVFGDDARLVRVLPSQAANAWVSGQILDFDDAFRTADALAIAPYLAFTIPPENQGEEPGAESVAEWSVDQLLDYVERESLAHAVAWMHAQHQAAQEHGLRLVAYEGGQHLVGIGGAENNTKLTQLLHAANAHPRMKEIYSKYYDAWAKEGGDLLCHFSSVGRWDKWGSWGLLQYADDDPAKSPKFRATMLWAKAHGQAVSFAE